MDNTTEVWLSNAGTESGNTEMTGVDVIVRSDVVDFSKVFVLRAFDGILVGRWILTTWEGFSVTIVRLVGHVGAPR